MTRRTVQLLSVHLLHHEGTPREEFECSLAHLDEHMHWTPQFAHTVLRHAQRAGLLTSEQGRLRLTSRGRDTARAMLVRS